MAVLKCKMCGGDLNVSGGEKIVECEFCGTTQTIPTSSDENLQGLFNRANVLRMKSEFDKAEQLYEKIIQSDETQAEAYWGLILCKYGIEYVVDPTSFKRIPTCHRTSFESVTADEDYKSALAYADSVQRDIYETEAKEIDRLQKEILTLSEKEEPYDVFICYKETDNDGKRTQDSVIANDIYHQLTQEGLKVFYAAITLEDKLGSAYEPYIFAALNSSKVMLVIGTKPEYFNAVWVKNEWSRYLKLIQKDRTKTLIPCYRDMDAYEMPEEFAHLQAQDMSKIGFINDVVRGIKKVMGGSEEKTSAINETVATSTTTNIAPLLERAFMFLEDGDFKSADEYCEKVLDIDPKCAKAYLGKLMAELRVRKEKELAYCKQSFENRNNYQKAIRFADEELKKRLTSYITTIIARNEEERLADIFDSAKLRMDAALTEEGFLKAAEKFETILEYKNSKELAKQCREKAEAARKDLILQNANSLLDDSHIWQGKDTDIDSYTKMIEQLETIKGYKDSTEKIQACQNKIEGIKEKQKQKRIAEENARMEQERKAEEERVLAEQKKKKNIKIAMIATPILCAIIAFVIVLNTVIIPNGKYNEAITLLESEKYEEALLAFKDIYGYKDSADYVKNFEIQYETVEILKNGKMLATEKREFDEKDNCVKFESFNMEGDISAQINYEYDESGNCVKEIYNNTKDNITKTTTSEYDKNNNLVRTASNVQHIGYDDTNTSTEYIYDNNNHVLKKTSTTNGVESITNYAYYNKKIVESGQDYYKKDFTREIYYNNNNDKIKAVSKDENDEVQYTVFYTYDEYGNILSEDVETVYEYSGGAVTYRYNQYGCLEQEMSDSQTTSYKNSGLHIKFNGGQNNAEKN